jgi:rubrerythrin
MSSRKDDVNEILKPEVEKILSTENMMYSYYDSLITKLKAGKMKDELTRIREEEKGHIAMATKMASLLLGV